MEEVWYKEIAYEDAKELVKENLVNTVAAFIASGYWLKYIRDSCGYKKDGYQNLWECAEAEFGLKTSEASRAMSMNDKYSMDGNSPFMADIYKQYNKSQLQEMLTMSEDQIEKVAPDMTIKEIREIKNSKVKDAGEDHGKLRGWADVFVWAEYMKLRRLYSGAEDISADKLWAAYDGKLDSRALCNFIVLGDAQSELVAADTGEIIGKYNSDAVVSMVMDSFLKLKERKGHKISPKVKGLLDDPYCGVCGAPLNSPETGNASMICAECGQAVEWGKYIKEFCDVATDTVNTESEGELPDEIITEIEISAEDTEELNIEFDTNELMKELDDIVDGEFREVTAADENGNDIQTMETADETTGDKGPKKCITGQSKYGFCVCCGYDGVRCCKECDKDCNVRCGWIDAQYIPGQETEDIQNDLYKIRQLLKRKNDELKEYLNCEGIPENTVFEKKTMVAALASMVCELEDEEEKEGAVETGQTELPKFKNNEQRKAWLKDVEAWGLWYEDNNIQARYYKYDFLDGSRLIAVKYRYTCPPWLQDSEYRELDGTYKDTHYHMVYSEDYRKDHKYEYEKYYTNSTVSISALVEFIKEMAKEVEAGEVSS